MKPRNDKNFLIEVTPEIMGELNRLYMHSDEEPIAELHFSPYWKSQADDPVNDLVSTNSKPTRTHTKSAQADPKRKANT